MEKNIYYLVLVTCLFICFNGCQQEKKDKKVIVSEGLTYHKPETGYGEPAHPGNYLKLEVIQSYKDSILNDSRKTGAQYQPYDSAQLSKEAWEVFKGVKTGDSLVFEVDADSAFKNSKPKFKVNGGKLITRVRVLKIFENADSARVDMEASRRF